MSDEMVLVPKALLSFVTADGLDVQDALDNLTGADWHSGSWIPQTAAEYHNQVIRGLIESADAESAHVTMNTQEGRNALAASLWLRDQMEGE